MKFIVAIEPATKKSAFGVVVPDLPGCFSAGETLDEAIQNAQEAIDLHCETLIEDGLDIPPVLPTHLKNSALVICPGMPTRTASINWFQWDARK